MRVNKMSAYLDLTLAMFISGSAVVASKMMVSSLPTFLATELGIFIGMIILLPLTFLIKKEAVKIDLRTHALLFSQALCGVFLYRIFTFVGLRYTTAATSGLITSAAPFLVVVIAILVLKEKGTLNQIVAVICTVIGLLIINLYTYGNNNTGTGSLKGNLLILAAVICEALFSILSKVKCKPITALYRTTVIVIYAFLLLLPFSVYDAFRYDFLNMDFKNVLCILYYGIFVSCLSYVLWFRGVEKVPVSNAAVFTSVVPISSIFLSAVILKEKISFVHFISLLFIMAGIWISCAKSFVGRAAADSHNS